MPRPQRALRRPYVPKMIILHHQNGQLGNPFSDREIDEMFPRTVRRLFTKVEETQNSLEKRVEVQEVIERGLSERKRKREETEREVFWDGSCLRSRSTGREIGGW